MDSIGYYIMIGLLAAGASYNLANRGKPRPALGSLGKKILIFCCGIVMACGVLLVAVAMISSQGSVSQ